MRFEKFLFQTQSLPTYVSPTGKLVVNTAVSAIKGEYTVNSDGTLSGPFTITITPPNSGTVLFEANGSVKGVRLAQQDDNGRYRHELPEAFRIRAKDVLGGLHHEYWLEKWRPRIQTEFVRATRRCLGVKRYSLAFVGTS